MGAPKPYQRMKERYPELVAAYEALGRQCHEAGPLGEKYRELVKVGIAIGARLEGAVHAHTRLALEKGATPDEVLHVALLATTTVGFSTMMTSRSWVEETIEKTTAQAASAERASR